MLIRAEIPARVYDKIEFDVWCEIEEIDRITADGIYEMLCDGGTGFGEWELTVLEPRA